MKRTNRVGRRKIGHRKIAGRKVVSGRIPRLKAAAEAGGEEANPARSRARHRANKKRITLYLDADVLAWFKQKPRYQREINRALWRLMKEGRELE